MVVTSAETPVFCVDFIEKNDARNAPVQWDFFVLPSRLWFHSHSAQCYIPCKKFCKRIHRA